MFSPVKKSKPQPFGVSSIVSALPTQNGFKIVAANPNGELTPVGLVEAIIAPWVHSVLLRVAVCEGMSCWLRKPEALSLML